MLKIFKKKPEDRLKKLSLLPTEYCHEDLTPLEISRKEAEQYNIKEKSFGYFVDNYFYNKIEICNNDTLHIETNVLTENDCEELINLYYSVLGVCNQGKSYFDDEDLVNLKRTTTAKVRNWELDYNNTSYYISVSNYSEGEDIILEIRSDITEFMP
jgi:hypothetical protein